MLFQFMAKNNGHAYNSLFLLNVKKKPKKNPTPSILATEYHLSENGIYINLTSVY